MDGNASDRQGKRSLALPRPTKTSFVTTVNYGSYNFYYSMYLTWNTWWDNRVKKPINRHRKVNFRNVKKSDSITELPGNFSEFLTLVMNKNLDKNIVACFARIFHTFPWLSCKCATVPWKTEAETGNGPKSNGDKLVKVRKRVRRIFFFKIFNFCVILLQTLKAPSLCMRVLQCSNNENDNGI